MKHKQWNFRHQPVGEVVLFWAVGHPGTTEIITCRRLSVLSASQTNSACCIHALLWHLYLPRHAVQKAEREGREHWTHGFMPCFVFLSFLFQFPLSHQFSLLLFIIIHPSSLPACLSVCVSVSVTPSPFFPLLLCLSFVDALMKSYFLDFLQNCLGALQEMPLPPPCFDDFE